MSGSAREAPHDRGALATIATSPTNLSNGMLTVLLLLLLLLLLLCGAVQTVDSVQGLVLV
jgi:hypothetical protein